MIPCCTKFDRPLRPGILVNPLSNRNKKNLQAVSKCTDSFEVIEKKVVTPDDIRQALWDFARQGVNLIVISGGDGTVQAALTILFHERPFKILPFLVILAGGTTNLIARDVGITGNQTKALKHLFKWIETDSGPMRIETRPVLRVEIPGTSIRYGMFFATAGICQGIQYYRRYLHNRKFGGLLGIPLTMIRYIWAAVIKEEKDINSMPIKVWLDGRPLEEKNFLLLFVTTLNRLLFGIRPYWGVEKRPLRFAAVGGSPKYLLSTLPFLMLGQPTRNSVPENGYHSHNVSNIVLELEGSMALDGEFFTSKPFQKPVLLQYGGTASFLRW